MVCLEGFQVQGEEANKIGLAESESIDLLVVNVEEVVQLEFQLPTMCSCII